MCFSWGGHQQFNRLHNGHTLTSVWITLYPPGLYSVFSNSKPWINPDIKALLKEKKRAFRSESKEELKAVQKELRKKISEGKNNYRRKMENQLQQRTSMGSGKALKQSQGRGLQTPRLRGIRHR